MILRRKAQNDPKGFSINDGMTEEEERAVTRAWIAQRQAGENVPFPRRPVRKGRLFIENRGSQPSFIADLREGTRWPSMQSDGSDSFSLPGTVRRCFPHFREDERGSTYAIDIDWNDIIEMIKFLATKDHYPPAVALLAQIEAQHEPTRSWRLWLAELWQRIRSLIGLTRQHA
jgi:hypothetical protein